MDRAIIRSSKTGRFCNAGKKIVVEKMINHKREAQQITTEQNSPKILAGRRIVELE